MTANLPTYNYLQFVRFKSLSLWDVKKNRIFDNKENSDYDFVRLADVLTQVKRVEFLQPTKDYNLLGVKSYGLGVFHRETKKGNDIKAKYLWKLKEGDLVYSRLGASSGSFGLINKDFDNYFVSNEFPAFTIDTDRVSPQYLNLVLTSKRFYEKIADFNTGSALKRFHEEKFLNLEIPLPPLKKQTKISDGYFNLFNKSIAENNKASELQIEIDKFLFKELGIEIKKEQKRKGINFIRYKELSKWGVEYNIGGIAINKILHSLIYNNDLLKNYVEINPSTNFNDLSFNDLSFIPMECISDEYGEISYTQTGTIQKSKGYTKFKNGDLLWAKITPCMENGKSAITNNLLNGYGYGSTEYHVLRAQSERISIEFIYNLLRTKLVREKATSTFTGSAGQQRVPKSFLDELLIPIPPIKKQNEINKYISNLKNQIKELHKSSKNNKEKAILEFEETIFL